MLKYVKQEKNADQKKVKAFKASDMWLHGFMEREGISVRARTNKKSRSAIKKIQMGKKLALEYNVQDTIRIFQTKEIILKN